MAASFRIELVEEGGESAPPAKQPYTPPSLERLDNLKGAPSFEDMKTLAELQSKTPAPIPKAQPELTQPTGKTAPDQPPNLVPPPTQPPNLVPPQPPGQPPNEPPTLEHAYGFPVPLPVIVTNWGDANWPGSQGGNAGPSPGGSPAPREQASNAPDFLGVIQRYFEGSLRASLSTLPRMLLDESGLLGGGKGGQGGGSNGGGGAGFFASGPPQLVYVDNWPLTQRVFVDNWPAQGGTQPPTSSAQNSPLTQPGGAEAAGEGAETAGAAEGATGLAELAGPAAIVVGVVDLAAKGVASACNAASAGIRGLGDSAAMMARNDNFGAVMNAANMAAGALGRVPIVGQAWEAELKLATTAVSTFAEVTNAFIERGRQLQNYSSDLAGANAMADIRNLLSDLDEAQTLGPALARLTDSSSELSAEFRDAFLPVKEFIIEVLAEVCQELIEWMPQIAGLIGAMLELAKESPAIFAHALLPIIGPFWAAGDVAGSVSKGYNEAMKRAENRSKTSRIKDLIDGQKELLERAANRVPFSGGSPAVGNGGPLGIPAFEG